MRTKGGGIVETHSLFVVFSIQVKKRWKKRTYGTCDKALVLYSVCFPALGKTSFDGSTWSHSGQHLNLFVPLSVGYEMEASLLFCLTNIS